ncbi:MAG: AzlD domain-containing protein [Lachnospiraceae bacterium]|nr:AzlD domain-containing protein [Lachnospiraceae bacterium]
MGNEFFIYLAVMALSTYLVRTIPFVAFSRKIKSRFIRSLLTYVPYAVLSAMTVPAIFFSTDSLISATAGFVTALILSLCNRSLITVAFFSCLSVFIVGLFV